MLARQTSKQESTVSHRPAFQSHWMLMSINFPLQLCIDPNCACPAKAHVLVKVAGFHLEAPRPRESAIFPWSPAGHLWASPGATVQSPQKLVQKSLNQLTTCRTTPQISNLWPPTRSSELYIYLFSCLQRTASSCLLQPTLAYHEPCTLAGFHPDLPQTLASAKYWETPNFYMSVSKLSHLWGN